MNKKSTMEISRKLQDLAELNDDWLRDVAGEFVGFMLVVFTDGRASYISNSNREDCIKEMKHLLEIWESGMPNVKAHEVQ